MNKLTSADSIKLLLCISMALLNATEVLAKRSPPKIAPLVMEYAGEQKTYEKNMLIEPSYECGGPSTVKVFVSRKHLSDKKIVWKTYLYTANYYLASLQWYDKGCQYVAAKDERHQSYCIDVETGKKLFKY